MLDFLRQFGAGVVQTPLLALDMLDGIDLLFGRLVEIGLLPAKLAKFRLGGGEFGGAPA